MKVHQTYAHYLYSILKSIIMKGNRTSWLCALALTTVLQCHTAPVASYHCQQYGQQRNICGYMSRLFRTLLKI